MRPLVHPLVHPLVLMACWLSVLAAPLVSQDAAPVDADPGATALEAYVETIPGTDVSFRMAPIPGGRFVMGSPDDEPGHQPDEGPQRVVELAPFWIGTHEVRWDEYNEFMLRLDVGRYAAGDAERVPADDQADAVSRPTPPYVPMDFGMGTTGYPAISMTQLAARQYTKWLSMKTGRFYRLPTEAEWEYAARAGTRAAWSCDGGELDDHAWHRGNADGSYHPVGGKLPNPWGLFDMHGNVAEWVLDEYDSEFYASDAAAGPGAVAWPTKLYPRVVRGGSWDDDAVRLRSAARRGSSAAWQMRDPQIPKSLWYLTDAPFVGLRVVHPLAEPTDEQREQAWEPDVASLRKILKRQQRGER